MEFDEREARIQARIQAERPLRSLQAMREWSANVETCLWRLAQKHWGEDVDTSAGCGNCSNCLRKREAAVSGVGMCVCAHRM